MAKVPYFNGRGKERSITGYSTVANHQEAVVRAKGGWVSHKNSRTGKVYVRLSGLHTPELLQHRFCWELEHGPIPPGMEIDHIDPDDTTNNDIDKNLRLATNAQNKQNKKRQVNSTSGYKGVTWSSYHGKWMVQVRDNGVGMYFGYWDDLELAARFL